MANRLTNIVTKTGDKGKTQNGKGELVSKSHVRVCAGGDVDELNSRLGILNCHLNHFPNIQTQLKTIQKALFDIGAELCLPGYVGITVENIETLEAQIHTLNQKLPPLKEFIIPGEDLASASAHVARAVCRRTERSIVKLHETEAISCNILVYINRLSDFLFVLARTIHLEVSDHETQWR